VAAFASFLVTAEWGAPAAVGMLTVFAAVAATTAIASIGVSHGLRELRRLLQPGVARSPAESRVLYRLVAATGLILIGNMALALFGAVVTLMATTGFGRGRQLRRRGKILLPPVTDGSAWSLTQLAPDVEPAHRAALAAQWRENGRTEHASVAAFAQLSLDLAVLGASPKLMADAKLDALDEIRHAELCFGLARALDGREMSPGAFRAAAQTRSLPRLRALALSRLAVDSLVDGALHEGTSARVIARLARRCEDPAIATMLREIAADESRHASHGWDVVAWCLDEGGESVAAALRGAASVIPKAMHSTVDAQAAGGAWERHGIPGRELEAEESAKARAMLHLRLNRLLSRSAAAA
jgi:hypothetical protein